MSFEPIAIEIPIAPVAKERPRVLKSGHAYTPIKTMRFEQELKKHWMISGIGMLPKCPTKIVVTFYIERPKTIPKSRKYPTVRPDNDNFQKAIYDGLNGVAWEDDSQLIDCRGIKLYAEDKPSIVIHVSPMEAA